MQRTSTATAMRGGRGAYAAPNARRGGRPVSLTELPYRPEVDPAVLAVMVVGTMAGLGFMLFTGSGNFWLNLAAGVMVLVGFAVMRAKPETLPILIIGYICFNRQVRRVLDWAVGEFSVLPATSLVVPLLGLAMGAVALRGWSTLARELRLGFVLLILAIVYGTGLGLASGQRIGAIHEALSWLAPIAMGLYVVWLRPSWPVFRGWVNWTVLFVVLTTVYGWIQWLILPPWDAFWAINANMASLGRVEPQLIRYFGTFGGPGPMAKLLTTTLVMAMIVNTMPKPLRLVACLMMGLSTVMTQVRSSWLVVFLAMGALLAQTRLREKIGLVVVFGACTVGGFFALPLLPGGEAMVQRIQTLGNVSADGSFRGRVAFSGWAMRAIAAQPWGYGFGSTGLSAMRTGEAGILVTAFDNGFLQIPFALGLPGAALVAAGFWSIGKVFFGKTRATIGAEKQQAIWMGRALVFGQVAALAVSNFLKTESAFLVWMMVGVVCVFVLADRAAGPARSPRGRAPATPRGTGGGGVRTDRRPGQATYGIGARRAGG
ncbi:MAG: O-antigen ligase family protein [Planctomycetota bacterium]